MSSAIDFNLGVRYSGQDVSDQSRLITGQKVRAIDGERARDVFGVDTDGSHEYLQGYCDNAKAIRNFRADRIVEVLEITDQVWPSNQLTDSDQAIEYQVKVHSASRQVLEVLPQISSNSSTATIKGYSAPWISRAILSLAGQVEALEPTQIRAAVHARAMAALQNYH